MSMEIPRIQNLGCAILLAYIALFLVESLLNRVSRLESGIS